MSVLTKQPGSSSAKNRKEIKRVGTKDNRPVGQGFYPEELPDVVVLIALKLKI